MDKATIKGTTRVGGLIGRGISHSLSPLIHNTAAAILGLDVVYIPFDFAEVPSPEFFRQMARSSCFGFNVTVPYKEAVAAHFPSSKLSSCNTLVPVDGEWQLASTDAEGFSAGLGEMERRLDDFTALIFLGYGGAAKALIAYAQKRLPQIPLFVLKRGPSEAPLQTVTFEPFEPESLTNLIKQFPKALVIQCTSAPLRGDLLERFDIRGLKGALVDLVYGTPSALLGQAKDLGIPSQDGIPMLIHQALLAQQLWWGQSATFSDMKAAIAAQR